MEDKIPDILYHYCSVDTFVKITQSKALRLSEIAKSNDSMECRWLEKEVFPKVFGNEINAFVKSFNEKADSTQVIECAEKIFNYPYEIMKFKLDEKLVFASCLSEEPDLLSQWRGYANDGMGVSIGFAKELFEEYYEPTIFGYVNFRRVIYDQTIQEAEILPEIKSFIEVLKREIERSKNGGKTYLNGPAYMEALELWISRWQKSICMKNDSFAEEKEWRLFTSFPAIESYAELQEVISKSETLKCFGDFGTISRNDKVVFYINLLLDKVGAKDQKLNWIKQVFIGPKCKLNKKDILFILESNGWDTSNLDVIRSRSTYN